MPKFKVEGRFTYGWDDAGWHDEDGKTPLFVNAAEAQTEIEDLIESTREAVELGHMDEVYDLADYRVVQVLCDEDPFPFGTHQGEPMGEISAGYYDWLQDWEGIGSCPKITEYMERNKEWIEKELLKEMN